MPLYDWYKSTKELKQVASIDDIGPFLTKYYSEKQLRGMSEKEVESLLQDLLDRGLQMKKQHHKRYAKVFNHQYEGPKAFDESEQKDLDKAIESLVHSSKH